MAREDGTSGLPFLSGGDDLISREDCRRRAFQYFFLAEEAGDPEKRDALLEGARKWLRLAERITNDGIDMRRA